MIDAGQPLQTGTKSFPPAAATIGVAAPQATLPLDLSSDSDHAVDTARLLVPDLTEDSKASENDSTLLLGKVTATGKETADECGTRRSSVNDVTSSSTSIMPLDDANASASKKRKISEDDDSACHQATISKDGNTAVLKKRRISEQPAVEYSEDASAAQKVNVAVTEEKDKSEAAAHHIPAISDGTENMKYTTASLVTPNLSKSQSPEATSRVESTPTQGKTDSGSNTLPAPEEGCINVQSGQTYRQGTTIPLVQADKDAFPESSGRGPALGISEQERKDLEALIKLAQRRLLWGHSIRHE